MQAKYEKNLLKYQMEKQRILSEKQSEERRKN